MAIDKLAAPYKKLFTKVKQLRERLEKVMSTDHIDLNELSKVRENLEFFEKKLQENRERKLQKKLELEKQQQETIVDVVEPTKDTPTETKTDAVIPDSTTPTTEPATETPAETSQPSPPSPPLTV